MSSRFSGRSRHINRATAGIQDNRAEDDRILASVTKRARSGSHVPTSVHTQILSARMRQIKAPLLQFAMSSHKSQRQKEAQIMNVVTQQNQFIIYVLIQAFVRLIPNLFGNQDLHAIARDSNRFSTSTAAPAPAYVQPDSPNAYIFALRPRASHQVNMQLLHIIHTQVYSMPVVVLSRARAGRREWVGVLMPAVEEGGTTVGSAGGRATEISLKAFNARTASKSNDTHLPSRARGLR